MSRKKRYNNKKTLKNRITSYVCKKKDVCCEEDIDRKIAIEQIFSLYGEIAEMFYEKDEYLSYINNDIGKFIGYKIHLQEKNDIEGIKLFNKIDNKTYKNKKLDKERITLLLNSVPLYYLLSFLGFAYYRYKTNKDAIDKANENQSTNIQKI
jgi:hypothetical protein